MQEWLTTTEAARMRKCSPLTITRAIKSGILKASKPLGSRNWLIELQDMEIFLRGNTDVSVKLESSSVEGKS